MNGNEHPPKSFQWINVLFLALAIVTLLVLSGYFLSLPEAHFESHKKRLTVIAKWLVAVLAFFGIKFVYKKSIYDIFGLWPVRTVISVMFAFCLAVIAPIHSITVDSDPAGADIYMAGETGSRGATPQKLGGLRLQMYDLRLTKPGYQDKNLAVSYFQVLTHARIANRLEQVLGKLWIRSEPSGAAVFLNDASQPRGVTPLKLELPTDIYTVALKMEGYRKVVRSDVEVTAGDEVTMSEVLESTETYDVVVLSYPEGAQIYVGAMRMGTTNATIELSKGTHQLRLVRNNRSIARIVDVPQQQEISVVFDQ